MAAPILAVILKRHYHYFVDLQEVDATLHKHPIFLKSILAIYGKFMKNFTIFGKFGVPDGVSIPFLPPNSICRLTQACHWIPTRSSREASSPTTGIRPIRYVI